MGAAARQRLLTLWEPLEFFRSVDDMTGSDESDLPGRAADVNKPGARAKILFDRRHYCEIDLSSRMTLDFGEPYLAAIMPTSRQLMCGVRQYDAQAGADRLVKWFICDEAFGRLVTLIRSDAWERPSNEALALRLFSEKHLDLYWAIARLVYHDDAISFARALLLHRRDPHPLYGYSRGGVEIDWAGMRLPRDPATSMHQLSKSLGEPRLWEEFGRYCRQKHIQYNHPDVLGCDACWPDQV